MNADPKLDTTIPQELIDIVTLSGGQVYSNPSEEQVSEYKFSPSALSKFIGLVKKAEIQKQHTIIASLISPSDRLIGASSDCV